MMAQRTTPRRRYPAQAPIAAPRLLLFLDAPAPDGLPRAGLLRPGDRVPVLFPSLPAALAALHGTEAPA